MTEPSEAAAETPVNPITSAGVIDPTEAVVDIFAYGDVDTGSNTSYSNVSTGSNSSYSDVATGSNTSYNDVAA